MAGDLTKEDALMIRQAARPRCLTVIAPSRMLKADDLVRRGLLRMVGTGASAAVYDATHAGRKALSQEPHHD